MDFVPYNIEKLSEYRTGGYIMDFIERFAESGHQCVVVKGYPHKTPNSCANAFRHAVKSAHRYSVKVTVRGGNVFLINTAVE